jgi:hypothetical protein
MTADSMQEKTAVFTFGSLSRAEEPRSYDMDEPTRELPLIAGRFAGREWTAEELRREFSENSGLSGKELRRRRIFTLAIGALCAMLLLVMSLVGQARLVDLDARTTAATETVSALRREQSELLVEYEQARIRAGSAEPTAVNDRIQRLRSVQISNHDQEAEDRITVLSVRRGRELHHFWHSLIDTLGVSFR